MSSNSSSVVLSLSYTQQDQAEKNTKNDWDFMSSLGKIKEDTNHSVYVHPLSKFSSSSLSPRSLEICTECLGSETGSGIDSNADEIEYYEQKITNRTRKARKSISKKSKPVTSFPPPLSSISGIEGIQFQTHREGGRLVIKAFSYTSCGGFLRAERENGRLRLSYFVRDNCVAENDRELDATEEEDEEENNADDEDERDCDAEIERDEDGFGALLWGDEDGEEESGILGWSSPNIIRCNDDGNGNKRIPSLPFCVAIS